MLSSLRTFVRWRATSRGTALAAVLSLGLSACADSLAPAARPADQTVAPRLDQSSGNGRRIANQYIVVLDNGETDVPGRARALVAAHGGQVGRTYTSALKGFSANMSAQAAEALSRAPGVAYVEQDQEISVAGTQSTPPSWGLDRIDQSALPLDKSYSYSSNGSGVRVYIIDTGIRSSHAEFGGRVASGFTSISDGYGTEGCHYHGTHVAGTVAGTNVGVAKGATVVPVRVLDCNGSGSSSGVVAGIDWIIAQGQLPAVVNMSISGGLSSAMNSAIEKGISAGLVFAVAAGNNSSLACSYSPASATNALTVAATTSSDAQASYSNHGSCVDIYAPGSAIYSAWNSGDNSYGTASGTSMATPHTAGAAALYLSANPGATPAQVAQALAANATSGAITNASSGTPNRLLRVNGSGGTVEPPPPPPATTEPAPVQNATPVASFAVSCQKNNCTFDGSSSKDDAGISSYAWNFGDGAAKVSAANPITTHVYSQKGNYTVTVTLTVTDNSGLTGTTSKSFTVKNNGK
jgi:serine protease